LRLLLQNVKGLTFSGTHGMLCINIDQSHTMGKQIQSMCDNLQDKKLNLCLICQNLKRSRYHEYTPVLQNFNLHMAVLITFNRCIKFEVSSFIDSEDITGST